MTLREKDLGAIERLIQIGNDISSAVEDSDYERPDPLEALQALNGEGEFECLEDSFNCYHEDVDELEDRRPPVKESYGFDASTVSKTFPDTGLIFGGALAKMGAFGDEADNSIRDSSTVVGNAYLPHSDSMFSDIEELSDGRIDVQVFEYPDPKKDTPYTKLSEWVSEYARVYAEGYHARRNMMDISSDSVLFKDGPLYPSLLFEWMLRYQCDISENRPSWDEMTQDCMQNFVKVWEHMVNEEIPYLGITKTSSGDRILTYLKEELGMPVPWNTDADLFQSLLQSEGIDGVSYTSWFVENRCRVGEIETGVKPFEGFPISKEFDDEDYRRGFCYVRPNNKRYVFRVEAPIQMLQTEEEREELRDLAVIECCEGMGAPEAVNDADERARISKYDSERLSEVFNYPDTDSYNQERNYEGDTQ